MRRDKGNRSFHSLGKWLAQAPHFVTEVTMMVLSIRMSVARAKRKELLQTVRALMPLYRRKTGCLSSRLYLEVEKEDVLLLLDEWETQDALSGHLHSSHHSSHLGVLLGAMKLLQEPPEINLYTVSSTAGIEAVNAIRNRKLR
jgi:quinol monooxygenase YgiN